MSNIVWLSFTIVFQNDEKRKIIKKKISVHNVYVQKIKVEYQAKKKLNRSSLICVSKLLVK